jgi:hypothetical protein
MTVETDVQNGAAEEAPPVTVDQSQVVETLQRKFAMLVAQLTYENAMLETALNNARGELGALRAKNEALTKAMAEA